MTFWMWNASTEQLGKTAGKDAVARKLTYPGLYGLVESKSKLAEVAGDEALDLSRELPSAPGACFRHWSPIWCLATIEMKRLDLIAG